MSRISIDPTRIMTIERHILEEQTYHPEATGVLTNLLYDLALAGEENENFLPVPDKYPKGKYILRYDPLDGSSNVDYNVPIGTIFAVHKRISEDGPGTLEDFLQPGRSLVASGYIAYGSSTMFVYTSGHGVHGFTPAS